MRNSRNLPTPGSSELPERASCNREVLRWTFLPSWCSARFTIQTLVCATVAAGEVDDDVVALGDAELVESAVRVTRLRQQVAVVGDLDQNGVPSRQRKLEEARHGAVQDAEAVLAPLHLEERLVGEVHRDAVAEEAVEVEDVEEELALVDPRPCPPASGSRRNRGCPSPWRVPLGSRRLTPSLISSLPRSSAAVDVEHAGIALVDVLRGEARTCGRGTSACSWSRASRPGSW